MGIPDLFTCILRNLCTGQEATVRTGHGTMDWFKIGKEYIKAVYCHPAYLTYIQRSVQFSSVTQSCTTLCEPTDCSTPGFLVHHQLLESSTQTHVHQVSDTIQPSHPLPSPSPPAFNLSQHQSLFKWVISLHKVAKVLEFQLQHQSLQWTFRTDFLQDGLVGSPCNPRDSHYGKCWAGWSQAGIKIAGRNINNVRKADNTTLMAESEKELKSLLMKVKEEW